MSEVSLWERVRSSRMLLVVAIAVIVGMCLWLAFIFPTIWASLMGLAAAQSDEEWWRAWQSYSRKLITMWFAPIAIGVLAVVFLILRAVLKPGRSA